MPCARARPGVRILLTHGTATGRAAGAPLLREGDAQAWLPFDTPGAVRRFLRHFAPRAGDPDGNRDLAQRASRLRARERCRCCSPTPA